MAIHVQIAMSESEQRTIFGSSIDELLTIKTSGRVIRPYKRVLDVLVDECKIHLQDDGLYVNAVDAPNVGMVECKLHASAFGTYDVKENTVLGIRLSSFGSALQHARYGKSSDDPILITADERHLETEVNRVIDGTNIQVNERIALIDPDSIRQEPDLPELNMDYQAEISPKAFTQVLNWFDTDSGEEIKLRTNPNGVVLNQEGSLDKRNVELEVESGLSETEQWTLFSADYVGNIAAILNNGYVDTLTLHWDDEYPLIAEFEREGVMSGKAMIAPRVKAE